jgi:riboflavin synthase
LFTGIIEESGVIHAIRRSPAGATVIIEAGRLAPELKVGDSIAVNGVCLTVVECKGRDFSSDLSAETLRRSSFAQGREGMIVNLERSLAVGDRLGGHIVQGHVDGIGRLLASIPSGEGFEMEFSVPPELDRYLVVKGSVAVDGISLTVASIKPGAFVVAVIPHTYHATNLQHLKKNDIVNLEGDILAKYIERFFRLSQPEDGNSRAKLTVESLKEQGY